MPSSLLVTHAIFLFQNYPQVQAANPTGLNRECNEDFSVCKKQGVQFQTPNTGMLTFMSDYTRADAPIEKLSVYRFFGECTHRSNATPLALR